jgi:hypothetical protein
MATLTGTAGSDRLNGTALADTLRGEGGNDVLLGNGGADSLYGGYGADELRGGDANDYLVGGSGNDFIYGDAGADTILSDGGDDRWTGGAGNDLFIVKNSGSTGRDVITDFASGDVILTKVKLADSNNDGVIPVATVLSLYSGSTLDIKNGSTDITSLLYGGTRQFEGATYYAYSSASGTTPPPPTPTPSGTVRFAVIGDYGESSGTAKVAQLIDNLNVDFILTVGDNVYGSETFDQGVGKYFSSYIGNYKGAYGSGAASNHFYPTLGNHDYSDGGLTNYLNYFTLPGNEKYYTFKIGPVQFFALDSNSQDPAGITSGSAQGQWLKNGLAASDSPYKIVYFHHAPFSSGLEHGSTPALQWPFEAWGATAVLSGHDHDYERVMRDDNGDGIKMPYFVDGLGGHSIYGFGSTVSGSAIRYNGDNGAMLVEANDQAITFKFVAVGAGGTGKVIDSFTIPLSASATASSSAATSLLAAEAASAPSDTSGYGAAHLHLLGHALTDFNAVF